jgi:hypothetical protein
MNPGPDPIVTQAAVLPALTGDALLDLEQLLTVEAAFLGKLDLSGIEAVAVKKEQLLPALKQITRDDADLARLQRIRVQAIRNQLLTVHAREAVAAIVTSFAPVAGATYAPRPRPGSLPSASTRPGPGARLNVKV